MSGIPELFMPKPRIVQYPFVLREGVMVYLHLPANLTMADVRRLTAMLETLTVDSRLQESPASSEGQSG